MKKMLFTASAASALGLLMITLGLTSCTEQEMAKTYGGTVTIDLPPNTRLMNVTWKTDHIWYLTRPAAPGEEPLTYEFHESSTFGVMEGTVILKESRK